MANVVKLKDEIKDRRRAEAERRRLKKRMYAPKGMVLLFDSYVLSWQRSLP